MELKNETDTNLKKGKQYEKDIKPEVHAEGHAFNFYAHRAPCRSCDHSNSGRDAAACAELGKEESQRNWLYE
jgi:hypothetical protein